MTFILDSSSLKYLLEELPRGVLSELWMCFEAECKNGTVISDRETKKMAEMELTSSESLAWLEKNKSVFQTISEKDAIELGHMMKKGLFSFYEHNQRLIERKLPEGVPFLLAMAKRPDSTIVCRKNGKDMSLITSICKKEGIQCIEVEAMLLELKRML